MSPKPRSSIELYRLEYTFYGLQVILVRRKTFSARDKGTLGWWCVPRREADVHPGRTRNQGQPSTQVSFGLGMALAAALASGTGKVSLHETKLDYTVGIW